MFDQLFKRASTRARHLTAPFAEERARYLAYCEQRGDSRSLQLRKAHDLLWIARKLDSHTELQVTIDQIRALVVDCQHWGDIGGPNLNLLSTRKRLLGHACAWLRYLGYRCEPSVQIPFGSRLLEYCDWAKQQRGLTDRSIYYFRGVIRQFLRWYGPIGRPLSSLQASDIDAYLAFGSGRGWARLTLHNVVAALRAFFRYGAQEGWGPPYLAATIQGPRLYAQERLPAGPPWAEVERLFAGLDVNRSTDVRDRAILMLFALYGLRESEVATLRLDDIDWEQDQLRIPRAKRREAQVYPLLPSLGRALSDYLRSVRRSTSHREIFLTLVSPYRPLSRSGLYDLVAARLKALNVQCAHHGPHSLRHACAARLVAQGLSLKEIGDHLGHRSTSATRVYAKVDLRGLREVAAFDLGELS
jgi:site-specific recombinase XerD